MDLVGNRTRVVIQLDDTDHAAADPTELTVILKVPGEDLESLVYGDDDEIVKDSTGRYHLDVDCPTGGTYRVRVEATGALVAAEEIDWRVASSSMVPA